MEGTLEIMATKIKMPAIHIPTLRASTAIVGTGFLNNNNNNSASAEAAWEESDSNPIFIDELVNGVQQCQAAVKRAADVLRRQQRHEDPVSGDKPLSARRVRSPQPIAERRPWGAPNAAAMVSPRNRSSSSTTDASSKHPSTAAKPVLHTSRPSSATGRPSSPSRLGNIQEPAAAPMFQRKPDVPRSSHSTTTTTAAPRSTIPAATVTATKPAPSRLKIEHHTPPTHRRNVEKTTTTPSPSTTTTTTSASSSNRHDHHQSLEAQIQSLTEQVHAEQHRADQAERQVDALTERLSHLEQDVEAAQLSSRQQALHFAAQQQHLWEVVRRLESMIVQQQLGDGLNDSSNSGASSQAHHQRLTVAQDYSHQQQQVWQTTQQHQQSPQAGSVTRKLDMSNESNRSLTRVPPNPPMELRHE